MKVTRSRLRVVLLFKNPTGFTFMKTPIALLGKLDAIVETEKRFVLATLYVVKAACSGNLLSGSTNYP